ncbi:hypothetical protein OHW20_03215 [Acinetobacter baumannii]|nr:hypothetical protein [Acinetobacter baumannii]
MIGLFDEIYKENYKYINALDALYFLVSEDNYAVSEIAKFLLIHDYHKTVKTYKKNYLGKMELVDFDEEDLSIDIYWRITKDILDKALGNFVYVSDINLEPYHESDYVDYFWLKEDLFNFEGFKKLGVKIDNDEYEKYLNYKQIDELQKTSTVSPLIKIYKDMEENLNSYWNLRVLPKMVMERDEQITIFDILRIAIRYYSVSYQFLSTFFHKFIYCPDDNLLDTTQNNLLLRLIENELSPSGEGFYKPISFGDFLKNDFAYNLVHWDIDDIAAFFIKQDSKIYEYENTLPRFCRGNDDSRIHIDENKKLKKELAEAQERIKQLETTHQISQVEIQTNSEKSKLGSTRAENNVAKLILVLGQMANIDVSKPYANYESLKTKAELLGIERFPSDENVASWLKRANSQNPN